LSATGYNSGNWDTAYGWGDHSTAGYLTSYTETDPVFNAHVASGITATNITNWNDAYNNKITAVNYSGNTLTLTQQDGGTLTTTIAGGGGASQWTTSGSNIYYNTGNVGIGTSSPNEPLTVSGNTLTYGSTGNVGSGVSLFLGNNSNSRDIALTRVASGSLGIGRYSGGWQETARFDSSGNVGIGKTPQYLLDVNGIANIQGNVAPTGNGLGIGDYGTTGGYKWIQTFGSQPLSINPLGNNVGIGTTSPTVKLDVETQATGNVASFTGAHPSRNLLITNYTSGGDGSSYAINANSGYGQIKLQTVSNDRIKIDNNGDISFYEDTGTTPKFFWDASAESLGIGTTSPAKTLHISDGTNDTPTTFRIENTDTSIQTAQEANSIEFYTNDASASGTGVTAKIAQVAENPGNQYGLAFSTYDVGLAEVMRIDESGNVGIGTATPTFGAISKGLEIEDTTAGIRLQGATTGAFEIYHNNGTSTLDSRPATGGIAKIAFKTEGSERMRIESDGKVGIGTSTVYADLQVHETSGAKLWITANGNNPSDAGSLRFAEQKDGFNYFEFKHDGSANKLSLDTTNGTLATFDRINQGVGIGTTTPNIYGKTAIKGGKAGTANSNLSLLTNGDGQGEDANLAFYGTFVGTSDNNPRRTADITSGFEGGNWGTEYLSFNVGKSGATNDTRSLTTERMRIDSAGKVGIGTTSPQAILHTATSGQEVARFESTGDSPTYISFKNNGTTAITGLGSVDNDVAIYTNSVEQMRINSAGKVGIGTASPSQKLDVNGTAKATTILSGNGTVSAPAYAFSDDTNTGIFRPFPDTLAFSEGGVERMRINSSGNVGVGVTSILAKLHVNGNILATSNLSCSAGGVITSAGFMNSPAFAIKSWTSTSSTFYPMLDFRTSGNTIVGKIQSNNTSTQYVTSSDERLKENIRNAEDAGAKIDAIQVRQFDWKANGLHEDYGVIAQELKEVAPEAVSEGNDEEEMWGVDYSKLVPTLIKEIQSLRNRVAELENN
jgi:hypothetical protein